jgi:hypothetical protein
MTDASTHERLHGSTATPGSDRSFALVLAAFFALVATLPCLHGRPPRLWALPVAATLLLVGLLRPRLVRHLNWLWFQLGVLLQRIVSPILLALVFFGAITPFAIVRRALGADPLRLKRVPSVSTCWIVREPGALTPESLRRQF